MNNKIVNNKKQINKLKIQIIIKMNNKRYYNKIKKKLNK